MFFILEYLLFLYQDAVGRMLSDVGRIKTSKTFPSLCRASMETSISHLETTAKVQTIDYNGQIQVKMPQTWLLSFSNGVWSGNCAPLKPMLSLNIKTNILSFTL